ncbi:MAG: nucleoside deaminase [Candidatus Omnitrophica bacterium]|nr:nucleoside deaminase [Candidatus Omnitrophota bacterium]
MREVLDVKFMRMSIKEAYKNIKKMEGGPFGACIVKGNKVLALGHNKVLVSDATAHAEIVAIREASRKLKTFDLSGTTIYSTTEPCPMCFSAIHWARISRVVYGTNIADALKIGFNELGIANNKMKKLGKSKVKITPGFLRKECLELLREWASLEDKRFY